ncbi:MAG TPA: hypothetical protein VGL72_29380 [Bryobacteraceae bacterium]|jgi:hypothetical protein
MGSVKEIEAAIENLPPGEFTQIVQWIRERDQALWDIQLDADSAAGKLDSLFAEAQPDDPSGLREWPAAN